MDLCLRGLKESSKSKFVSFRVRNSVLVISHFTFVDCRVHIFPDNVSRNNCKQGLKCLRAGHAMVIHLFKQ